MGRWKMEDRDRFLEIIVAAATKYFGPINNKLSKPGVELRFGTHGSKSVDPKTAKWFDHELNIGGGVADLIRRYEPNANVAERMAYFGLPKDNAPKRRETVFDYCDEHGEVRYQVVRIDTIENGKTSKTYRQRKINAETGKPEWSMMGVEALPYRLDAILARPKTTVFVVEGEKCVDALIAQGFVATTNHGGAAKWTPALSPWLKDRNVVIIPDNDAPGEKHLHQVAGALSGVAASIKVLRLPDLAKKGDVADYLANGGTRKELIELAKAAPDYDLGNVIEHGEEPATVAVDGDIFKIDTLATLKDVPVKWLLKDMIPAQSFVALYGKPGSYKSFVALYLAMMIATGQEAFGRETEIGDVLYIAGEGGSGLKARSDAMATRYNVDGARIGFIRHQLNLRSTTDDVEKLIRSIEVASLKPSLIIVDTLARAFGGGNENASEDMGAFISNIGLIQDRLATAVMIVHHSGKDEARGQRGHSSLLGAVDAELEVIKISDDDQDERIGKLTITKQKDGEDGIEIGYRMDVVRLSPLGLDERTSLVVEPIDELPEKKKKPRRLSPAGEDLKAALDKAIGEGGETIGGANIPSDRKVITQSLLKETFWMVSRNETEDTKAKAYQRGRNELIRRNELKIYSKYAWIPDTYEEKGHLGHLGHLSNSESVPKNPKKDTWDTYPIKVSKVSLDLPPSVRENESDDTVAAKEPFDASRAYAGVTVDDFGVDLSELEF